MRRSLLSLALLVLAAGPLAAQATPPGQGAPAAPSTAPCPQLADTTMIDRVVAVVGDSVVLMTDLQQACLVERASGRDTPAETILQGLVDLQMLLQHAARDSTVIPDPADVTRRVDEEMERVRREFPSEAEFLRALSNEGLSLSAFRDRRRAEIRTQMIRDAYVRRLLQSAPPVAVSETEMRAFFDANRGQLQERPEILTIQQVLIRSGASDSAWARALHVADSLYVLVARGADFAALARAHSDDPGSAQRGGDLEWVPRGMTVPEFERAAFALRDGQISPPVRTEYGYHIILSERSRGTGEKRLRHILITPETVPGDIERTRALGEEVARRIRAGESALTLAQQYGDPSLPREVQATRADAGQGMPPEAAELFATAREGEVIGPIQVATDGFQYVVVRYVADVRAAGEFTFEDVRDQIRSILIDQKRRERIFGGLRERTYVELRY